MRSARTRAARRPGQRIGRHRDQGRGRHDRRDDRLGPQHHLGQRRQRGQFLPDLQRPQSPERRGRQLDRHRRDRHHRPGQRPGRRNHEYGYATGILIGGAKAADGNTIAYNAGSGVGVGTTPRSVDDAILSNAIYGNQGLGIDLGDDGVTPNHPGGPTPGPNDYQNYPVLLAAITYNGRTYIMGTLNSAPDTTFTLQFFSDPTADPSGYGQGQTYLGQTTVTTDANGNAASRPASRRPSRPVRPSPARRPTRVATHPSSPPISRSSPAARPSSPATTVPHRPEQYAHRRRRRESRQMTSIRAARRFVGRRDRPVGWHADPQYRRCIHLHAQHQLRGDG